MVVAVQVLEDVGSDDARVEVDELRRIEAGFGNFELVAQRPDAVVAVLRRRRQADADKRRAGAGRFQRRAA